jgi:hypothetical protein
VALSAVRRTALYSRDDRATVKIINRQNNKEDVKKKLIKRTTTQTQSTDKTKGGRHEKID